jgi:hypothetical protein
MPSGAGQNALAPSAQHRDDIGFAAGVARVSRTASSMVRLLFPLEMIRQNDHQRVQYYPLVAAAAVGHGIRPTRGRRDAHSFQPPDRDHAAGNVRNTQTTT